MCNRRDNIVLIDSNDKIELMFEELCSLRKMKHMIYRGLTNVSFELVPSLYRIPVDNIDRTYINENDQFEVFDKFIKNEEKLEFYQALQHYGLKTKLLDFTHNPFIGLLFAIKDWPFSEDNRNKDGELLVFDSNQFEKIKHNDFPTFGELLFDERNGTTGIKYDDTQGSWVRFSNGIRFMDGIKNKNTRLIKQEGCFLIFPNLSEKGCLNPLPKEKAYKRFVIKSYLKPIIETMLNEKEKVCILELL